VRMHPDHVAFNPILWSATADGWLDPALMPPLAHRLTVIREAGFRAVHAAVPPGMTPQAYRHLLADYGLVPAPGYIGLALPATTDRTQELERVRRAAGEQAALELASVFVALELRRDAPRVAHPAIGYDAQPERLAAVRDWLGEAAAVIRGEGVMPALHPHVGTWIETEEEVHFVLDTLPADVLGFGPDLGHLRWAGADAPALIRAYRPRVRALHVKDVQPAVVAASKRAGWGYAQTVRAGVFTEPEPGSPRVAAALGALPERYDGWLVIEVDRGTRPTAEESVRICGAWARGQH
jgi:inosose dehydratase